MFLTRKPFSFSDESSDSKHFNVLVKDRFIRYSLIKLSIVILAAAHGIEVRGIILNKLHKKIDINNIKIQQVYAIKSYT